VEKHKNTCVDVSTEQLQYHNVKHNEFPIYSVTGNDRWPKIMAHTTSIRQYGTASHHVSTKADWAAPRSK